VKSSVHLFQGKTPPSVESPIVAPHPMLDVSKLRAATDLAVKVKSMLSSR
jgi:hypothetical protein